MECMTRELTAEAGDGDQYKHVTFGLFDRHLNRLLRPQEVADMGIVLSADGKLLRHGASWNWKDGQPAPTPELLTQEVGARYDICVKVASG